MYPDRILVGTNAQRAIELGRVYKPDSQIGKVLIQGSFGRSFRDPWIDERSGMVLS